MILITNNHCIYYKFEKNSMKEQYSGVASTSTSHFSRMFNDPRTIKSSNT